MKYLCRILSIVFFTSICCISCKKRDKPPVVISTEWPKDSIRTVIDNLNFPWEILWGKDNQIWMTERGGRISRINPKDGVRNFTFTVPDVVASGEGGLLGMVQDPNFTVNGYLYIVYNYNKNNTYTEKVVRYTYQNNTLANPLVLIDNIPAASIHNGSRLLITADNKLFVTTGDASIPSMSQDINSLSGKVLRINLDGTIPGDNPINGNRYWSFGHRNPQGMVAVNGILYTSEHGPNIEDEINITDKGRNYGWPNVNGPCDGLEINFCNVNNVKEPLFSSGNETLAYCGLDYYNHARITQWKNSLLLVTLKDQSLRQLKLSSDGRSVIASKTYFKNLFGRLRDVCVSPEGRVYLCTSNGNGFDKLIEIQKPE